MAFRAEGLSTQDLELHKDHSRLITGTVAATLLGHGYREDGDVSHMDGIMRIYSRMRGEGVSSKRTNAAMQAGIDLEPVAFEQLRKKLSQESIEGYEGLATYEPLAGLRLDDTIGEGLGFGANIDAPLISLEGEREDPTTGETISMRAYAEKWALLESHRQSVEAQNARRQVMGESLIEVPDNPLPEPPFAGVADLKATMSYDVRLEVDAKGPYSGWIVQLHHYNAALKAKNEQNGYDTEDYPNALLIGHLYSGDMKTRVHQVPYDADLEAEIIRRGQLFLDCVEKGLSPDSPAMKHHFTEYPVKRLPPSATLASPDTEELLEKGIKKLEFCESKVKLWQEEKQDTLDKLQGVYDQEVKHEGQSLYANGAELVLSRGSRESRSINREAVNGVIDAAADVRTRVEKAIAMLESGEPDAALKELAQARVERLPEHNVRSLDAYELVTKKETKPSFSVKRTKKAAKVYESLKADAQKVVHEEPETTPPQEIPRALQATMGEQPRQAPKAEQPQTPAETPKPAKAPEKPAGAVPPPFGY